MAELERAIIMMIWSDIQVLPSYDTWRKYERSFTYDTKKYRYKCKYRLQDGFLRLRDTSITHEQITIDLIH